MGGHCVVERRELSQPFQLVRAERLNRLPPIGPADHRADSQNNDVGQCVRLVTLDPRVPQWRKMLKDAL